MRGRVLIVAGSDSGGGAGIQADIKTVTALGGYAMTAITALTAQNTLGVSGIHEVPAAFVVAQIRAVVDDLGVDCVKLGMLHRAEVIDTVCDVLLERLRGVPVVVDPVMVAKGGDRLLTPAAVEVLRRRLVPLATVLTPNLPEAEVLAEATADGVTLAHRLLALGPVAVLVKGGHAAGLSVADILLQRHGEEEVFQSPRIATRHSHGTGCTLASAIATGLAQGSDIRSSVVRARAYVREAILQAPGFGAGNGPLHHGHTVRPFP